MTTTASVRKWLVIITMRTMIITTRRLMIIALSYTENFLRLKLL